ncbi:MAG: hypothetical protein ACI8U4_001002 [Natronomonas sp.]
MNERAHERSRLTRWNGTWSLALVFGLASVPWTYAFVAELHIPLWPSFIASATYYATDETGIEGLKKGYASNFAGILYAAATIAVVDTVFAGSFVALSVVVGAFMFVASLHEFVPFLSFTPGGFFGYATMFSIDAAGATAFGIAGLGGETLAALVAMLIGAIIGIGTDELSTALG